MSMKSEKREGKPRPPKGEKITKEITFELTQRRIAELGRENAEMDKTISDLEMEKKAKADEYKAKIDAIASRRMENSALIRAEHETKAVECILVKDFEANSVRYWFEGKYFDERAMTEEERQTVFDLPRRIGRGSRSAETSPPAA